jgi:lipoprotein-anchoring transpeptidase ErfK/SrfK
MPHAARIVAAAVAVLALAATTAVSLARPAQKASPAQKAPRAISAPNGSPAALAPPGPPRKHLRPPDPAAGPKPPLIARVRAGKSVAVHRSPEASSRARRLGPKTEFGSPRTLAVHAVRGRWLGVASGARTDGRLGWVNARSRGIVVRRTRVRLEIDLSRRRVKLLEGDRVARRVPVAVGAPRTSTPTGRFAVTDKLRGTNFGPYYGCCVLALSGTQPNLPPGWTGGNRLAIHGTTAPGSIGSASTAGCPRAADRDLRVLMRRVPLGTPVEIHR